MIVGDMDSVSDDVLRCGAEVDRARLSRRPRPGWPACSSSVLQAITFPGGGHQRGHRDAARRREGRVAARGGRHARDADRVPRQGSRRHGSTFLTRLQLGGKLVDAKGVSRLYRQSLSGSSPVLLVCSAIAAMTAALAVTTVGRAYLGVLAEWWDNLMFTLFS
jgi:uncharacterized membrane-anchored protein